MNMGGVRDEERQESASPTLCNVNLPMLATQARARGAQAQLAETRATQRTREPNDHTGNMRMDNVLP